MAYHSRGTQDQVATAASRNVPTGDAARSDGVAPSTGEHTATSTTPDVHAHFTHTVRAVDGGAPPATAHEQGAVKPGTRVAIEPAASDSRSNSDTPAVAAVYHVSATPERAPEGSNAPAFEALVGSWRPTERITSGATERSGDTPSPQPAVHIGSIEIIVEAPAAPRAAASAPATTADFSSRHYLRGL